MAKGNITIPAENMRSEAIWAQVSSSLLAFIRINELPQIIHNKINIPQLTNLSFLIMMRLSGYRFRSYWKKYFVQAAKGQQSTAEESIFLSFM